MLLNPHAITADYQRCRRCSSATPGMKELTYSATIAVVGQVPISRLWHAVPCFPSISEVWLRLLEAYRG